MPTAEEEWSEAALHLQRFDRSLTLSQKREIGGPASLPPSLRRLRTERRRRVHEERFWREVVGLKGALVTLNGGDEGQRKVAGEAEGIARETARSVRDLKGRYRMVRPAKFHNVLINVGVKKEGLCWHWTRDLTARLASLNLTRYDLHWGISREGTIREHNALIVTSHGRPFEEGLVIDGWRKGGRLTWVPVRADSYPWKEQPPEAGGGP